MNRFFHFAKIMIDNDKSLDTAYVAKIFNKRFCFYERKLHKIISCEKVDNVMPLEPGLVLTEMIIEPIFSKRR